MIEQEFDLGCALKENLNAIDNEIVVLKDKLTALDAEKIRLSQEKENLVDKGIKGIGKRQAIKKRLREIEDEKESIQESIRDLSHSRAKAASVLAPLEHEAALKAHNDSIVNIAQLMTIYNERVAELNELGKGLRDIALNRWQYDEARKSLLKPGTDSADVLKFPIQSGSLPQDVPLVEIFNKAFVDDYVSKTKPQEVVSDEK